MGVPYLPIFAGEERQPAALNAGRPSRRGGARLRLDNFRRPG